MNDTNRDYYKRMYDKIHASEELQERLINMKKNNVTEYQLAQNGKQAKKKAGSSAWKVAAAVVALSVIIPTGVYAAGHYFGISDFFKQNGHKLTADADKLIEKNIPQTTEKNTSEEMPVTFTVQEALCDSGAVRVVIEVKAKESGRYLLVPQDALETDSLENIGITGQGTIGEYAKKKNLEILYVGSGFQDGSPFFPDVSSYSEKFLSDDTMAICVTAERTPEDTDLDVIMMNTVRRAGSDDIIRTTTSFGLQDGSSSEEVMYAVSGSMEVPGTQAVITKVVMEKTEVSTYVTVYYTDPQGESDEDGLVFRMKDKPGENTWHEDGGSGVISLGNGSYKQRMVYDAVDFPKECTLEAFNCWEKNIYGQFELKKSE